MPYLTGKVLIAAPDMADRRFRRAVVLLCDHDDGHAMGIILNKAMPRLTLPKLLGQIGVDNAIMAPKLPVLDGGPCQRDRGFVLHSDDWESHDATLPVAEGIRMTATRDVLEAMTGARPPRQAMLALGFSSWGPGQLESEIRENAWLVGDLDPDIILSGANLSTKWSAALSRLGVDPRFLSAQTGRA